MLALRKTAAGGHCVECGSKCFTGTVFADNSRHYVCSTKCVQQYVNKIERSASNDQSLDAKQNKDDNRVRTSQNAAVTYKEIEEDDDDLFGGVDSDSEENSDAEISAEDGRGDSKMPSLMRLTGSSNANNKTFRCYECGIACNTFALAKDGCKVAVCTNECLDKINSSVATSSSFGDTDTSRRNAEQFAATDDNVASVGCGLRSKFTIMESDNEKLREQLDERKEIAEIQSMWIDITRRLWNDQVHLIAQLIGAQKRAYDAKQPKSDAVRAFERRLIDNQEWIAKESIGTLLGNAEVGAALQQLLINHVNGVKDIVAEMYAIGSITSNVLKNGVLRGNLGREPFTNDIEAVVTKMLPGAAEGEEIALRNSLTIVNGEDRSEALRNLLSSIGEWYDNAKKIIDAVVDNVPTITKLPSSITAPGPLKLIRMHLGYTLMQASAYAEGDYDAYIGYIDLSTNAIGDIGTAIALAVMDTVLNEQKRNVSDIRDTVTEIDQAIVSGKSRLAKK